jgi:hypothetical protein
MRALFSLIPAGALCVAVGIAGTAVDAADPGRIAAGLQLLYDFSEVDGDIVRDRAHDDSAGDLRISDLQHVERTEGSLRIVKPTIIASVRPPTRLIHAVRSSGEFTVETWCEPHDTRQKGPARLVTISANASSRNFTLGQDQNKFDARLRTTGTSKNGTPSVASPAMSVSTDLTHVIYTCSRDGSARFYINGRAVTRRNVPGSMSNWDDSHRFGLANELSAGRPWLGTIHLVAVYDRALSAAEVDVNFVAGPAGRPSPERVALRKQKKAAKHFETVVAPIFARRCLECHDSATHEHGLDLSRRISAFDSGENGRMILPGNSEDSLVWTAVESDSMPSERPPLTDVEKTALKKWIDDGAVWTLDEIDPANYVHHSSGELFVQRLTVPQYIETVRAALGVDIEQEAWDLLPADLRADGFSNTAYNLTVDLKHVDAYGRLAEIIVGRLDTQAFVSRFSRKRRFTDKEMGAVISAVGKWLLRGPLQEREIIAWRGITTTVAGSGGSFEEALELVIEGMLQSPRFVYRIENQRGTGLAQPVDQYELASRLSYIIWGGPPDESLLNAADKAQLHGPAIDQQVARMLEDRRAIRQSIRFIDDWLNLSRLDNLQPNAHRFPNWDPQLAQDMKGETSRYFEHVVWDQNRPLADLLNSQVTWATPRLAACYGLQDAPALAEDNSWRAYDLAGISGRGGLLTQGSLLTVGGDEASMVTRGLLVMHELLRGVVKDPPPCVDTTPIPTSPGVTQRSIAQRRIDNVSCGGCHGRFEPLAFGLEKFDGIGAWHEQDEHGNPLRDDGEVLFPGTSEPVKFESSAELMDMLANSERVRQSLTWKITQFALGRPLGARDAASVDSIHQVLQESGGTWKAAMTAIVTSDLVLSTRTEGDPD